MSDSPEKAAQDTRSCAEMAGPEAGSVESRLARIRIVLINTTHPGNIGAAARAMKVMGLSSLHLVTPKIYPSAEATAMASGADDVLQNTLLKAWKNIDRFRAESALKTWLYRIATNESLTFLNQQKRRAYEGVENLEDDLRHSLSSGGYVDGDAIQHKLQQAILGLPDRQRLVFNMRYYDELKYEEMADVLGVTVGALKASYHHAVKKIETYLTTN